MERRIEIYPSWDKGELYGIDCAEIAFYLIGKRGAYQFKAFTGWWLPHLRKQERCQPGRHGFSYPRGFDIGYHAREAQYEGQEPLTDDCPIIGGKCYYDGSSLQAEPIAEAMVAEGSDAVWAELENRYIDQFGALE